MKNEPEGAQVSSSLETVRMSQSWALPFILHPWRISVKNHIAVPLKWKNNFFIYFMYERERERVEGEKGRREERQRERDR